MTEKREFQVNKNTPFWDASLTDQERIDWLLKEMTVEEKLGYLASSSPDLPRLGIPGVSVGGEAAHGVEGRNDQNGLGKPDVTTSFPQPIGMSASWDPELIRQAGEITGTEARVVWHRHEGHGLSRWAPTVDLERDPRWGRNEEGYGEDPVLTGKMAGAYIRGMQGDDPKYLRCAATLKHFYGNNTEVGRGWKNSSIDPRNKYELYLEPFRRCIEDGGAEGIMTAYNKINGTIGILNPEVTDILKKQYGLRHVVSDGGAMGLVVTLHHYFGQHAETIATALKAGVDAMSDDPRMVEQAAREAYELGILKEEDMDRSIRCMMETKLRLGVYDRENLNPYDRVTEDEIDSPKAREICKELSRESIVLLKNENGALPLDKALKAEDIAIVGPLGDAWYQDWYGGTAPYRTTFLQGMEVLKQENITFADGLDRVVFRCDGKGLAVAKDGTLQMADEPDVFIKEYWGEGSYTFKSVRTGKYLGARLSESQGEKPKMGQIAADREEAFDWFVMEIFHVEPQEDGSVVLTNRFHYPVYMDAEGFFSFEQTEGIPITMEVVEKGIEKAVAAVRGKKQVLLALGCNSVINAKEEIDRNTLELPDEQEMLLDRIAEANPNTVLVLFTNYPYTLQKAMEKLPGFPVQRVASRPGQCFSHGQNQAAGRLVSSRRIPERNRRSGRPRRLRYRPYFSHRERSAADGRLLRKPYSSHTQMCIRQAIAEWIQYLPVEIAVRSFSFDDVVIVNVRQLIDTLIPGHIQTAGRCIDSKHSLCHCASHILASRCRRCCLTGSQRSIRIPFWCYLRIIRTHFRKRWKNCRRSSCLQREARIWEAQWQKLCLEPMHRPVVF